METNRMETAPAVKPLLPRRADRRRLPPGYRIPDDDIPGKLQKPRTPVPDLHNILKIRSFHVVTRDATTLQERRRAAGTGRTRTG
jgi:hypothetical protein